MGGLHRRKKRTVSTIYGFSGLRSIEDHQALLETVTIETMALENSIPRNRLVGNLLTTGAKLLEVGVLEARLSSLEGAVHRRTDVDPPSFGDGD